MKPFKGLGNIPVGERKGGRIHRQRPQTKVKRSDIYIIAAFSVSSLKETTFHLNA